MKKILFFVIIFIAIVSGQQLLPTAHVKADAQGLKQAERQMVKYILQARKCLEDTCIREKNNIFKVFLEEQAEIYAAKWMDFPFEKLKKYISILRTDDKKCLIFTWNLQRSNREHIFFGYVFLENNKKKPTLIPLRSMGLDKKLVLSKLIHQPLSDKNWYGALYQSVLTKTLADKKYYVLLGWDGLHDQVHRKIIDVLQVEDQKPELVFGAPIFFLTPQAKQQRVIVEYMPKSAYFLTYKTALDAVQMDHVQSYVEQTDLPFFKVPTGHFDLFVWQQKGFYLLEKFSGDQQEWPQQISQRLRQKFLKAFVPAAVNVPQKKKQSFLVR